jgi:hypothetical protein
MASGQGHSDLKVLSQMKKTTLVFPNEEIFHVSLPLYDATLKGILASSSSCFSKNIETFGILEFQLAKTLLSLHNHIKF